MKPFAALLLIVIVVGCASTRISEADARSKQDEIRRAAQKMGEETSEDRR